MTRVDFYILDNGYPENRERFACKLIEKAFHAGHRIFIKTGDEEQNQRVNQMLWTFRQNSFIPHEPWSSQAAEQTPVLLGYEENGVDEHDILINLDNSIPGFFGQFERVIEVIDNQESVKKSGRDRYRHYKDRGYELNSHNIGNQA